MAAKTNRLITIFWAEGAATRMGDALTLEIPLRASGEPMYRNGEGFIEVSDVNGTKFRFERGPILYVLQSDLTKVEYEDWKKQVEARNQ